MTFMISTNKSAVDINDSFNYITFQRPKDKQGQKHP